MLSTYFTFSTVSTTVTADFYHLGFFALNKTETMVLLTLWSYGLPSTVQNLGQMEKQDWILDWTLDWTLDWALDWTLDLLWLTCKNMNQTQYFSNQLINKNKVEF